MWPRTVVRVSSVLVASGELVGDVVNVEWLFGYGHGRCSVGNSGSGGEVPGVSAHDL